MSVNVGSAVGYLDLDFSKFSAGFKSATKELQGFTDKSNSLGDRVTNLGGTLKSVGSSMTKNFTLPLVGIGAVSVKTAADFEAGMSKVQAISGATGNDMQKLEKMAKDLGASTKFSATEAAEALSFMGMAGWDTQSMLDGLPGVLDLAAAGGTDLATTSDIVTDGLTSLGLTAKDTGMFVDVMAATCNSSNTSIELMGETLKYVGPVAGALGIDMQSLSSAIGLMGNAGIKGSQAGTALRAGLNRLIKPTDESAAAMKKYGIEIQKNSDGSVDLMSTMHLLRGKLGDLDETTQAAALSTIFGTEAMSGWAAIVNATESDFEKLNESIYNADGAAKQVADTMQDNLSGQLTNLKSALEGAAISIGNALLPVMKILVEWIQKAVDWFNNLSPGIQTAIVVIGGLVAAIGPVLMIIGQMVIGIGGLITAFGTVGVAGPMAGGAIAALAGPVGIAIAAIAALVAVGVYLYNNWDAIKAKALEVWEMVKSTVSSAWEVISSTTMSIWNSISSFLSGIWQGILNFISPIVNFIGSLISTVWSFISNVTSSIWNSIKGIIQSVWELIKSIINLALTLIKTWVTMQWNAVKTVTTTVWNAVKSVIQTVWNAIKPIVQAGVDFVKNIVTTVFNAVSSFVTTVWNGIKNAIQTVWNAIKSVVQTGANLVKSTVSSVFGTIEAILTAPFKAAQSVISGILGGITSAINKVTSAIKNVTNMGKSMPSPQMQEGVADIPNAYNEVDYSNVKFNYVSARNTSVSDVIASNRSMIDTFKGFASEIKTDNKQGNVSTDNNITLSLNIDKFVNESKQDINELMDEISFQLKRKSFI